MTSTATIMYNKQKPVIRGHQKKKSYGRVVLSEDFNYDDHDGRFRPKRVSSAAQLDRKVKHLRKSKLAKYGIPMLYLIVLVIVLSSTSSSGKKDNSLWSYLTDRDLPDAKNELLEDHAEESKTEKEFPYTADICVLPNSPYKHVIETTDIRSTVTIYYDALADYLRTLKEQPKTELPVFQFNWKDWVDMKDLQPLIEEKPDCFIAGVLGSNVRTEWPDCVDANTAKEDSLNFYFTHAASQHESQFRLNLRAKTYLYAAAPNPSSLVFLLKDLALIVKVNGKKDLIKSGMLEKFIKNKMERESKSYQEVLVEPISVYKTAGAVEHILGDKLVETGDDIPNEVVIDNKKFKYSSDKKKSKLAAAAFNSDDKYFYDILIKEGADKYREAYDWRYFKKAIDDENQRHEVLHQLIRGWLQMTNNLGINTWLSQESLLGWDKNGLLSPWERTAHFDVPAEDMKRLATSFNQSLVIQDPRDGTGLFLIDVQPYYMERAIENNGNASPDSTDMRFIDTRTGMYLEINGLVKSKDMLTVSEQILGSLSADAAYLSQIGLTVENQVVGSMGKIVNSGSGQFYHIDQISPLKKTLFEGRLANVPNRHSQILKGFYGYLPTLNAFNEHKYVDHLRLWVDDDKCKYVPSEDIELFNNGGSSFIGACHDNKIWQKYVSSAESTLFRKQEKNNEIVGTLSNDNQFSSYYDDVYLSIRMEMLNKVYRIEYPQRPELVSETVGELITDDLEDEAHKYVKV